MKHIKEHIICLTFHTVHLFKVRGCSRGLVDSMRSIMPRVFFHKVILRVELEKDLWAYWMAILVRVCQEPSRRARVNKHSVRMQRLP